MSEEWNISLFHYRNHSDAYGRVLVGVQVPANQTADFEAYLDCLKYPYVSEQDNPAYHLFLSTN
jgi:threonine dehydratase